MAGQGRAGHNPVLPCYLKEVIVDKTSGKTIKVIYTCGHFGEVFLHTLEKSGFTATQFLSCINIENHSKRVKAEAARIAKITNRRHLC